MDAGPCTREERRQRILAKRREDIKLAKSMREDREVAAIVELQQVARDSTTVSRKKRAESHVRAKRAACRKKAAAERHNISSQLLFRGWRPWAKLTRMAQLQRIKAQRYHAYCVMHRTWTHWTAYVAISKAERTKSKNEQIQRLVKILEIFFPKRKAWRRWSYHHYCLMQCSARVRSAAHHSVLSNHLDKWTIAWANRARHRATSEQDVSRMGQRAKKSRFFREWKDALETQRKNKTLAEERRQIRQQVNKWLTPVGSL